MYIIVDNKDYSIMAVCASEDLAKLFLSSLPNADEVLDPADDEDFKRFAYEKCAVNDVITCIPYPSNIQIKHNVLIYKF